MRWGIALVLFGLVALMAQGAVATFLPPPFCPDLALLVVLVLGLRWEGVASGLLMAALLGYATDMLSGSLLGQHALLRLFVFAGARLASSQLNLRGALPLSIFAAGVSLAYGGALLGLTGFFAAPAVPSWSWFADLVEHALVNAIVAPAVYSAVEWIALWSGEDEAGRRPLRLEPRRPAS